MKLEKLEKDSYYHIYNRGINSTTIFKTDNNSAYFLKLVGKYLNGKANIIAFCLMKNHYHFILKIIEDEKIVTQALSNLFNAYAKAYNKQQNRTGSLFEKHFKRKKLITETYLKNATIYVHNNPKYNPELYLFSSLNYYLAKRNPKVFNIDNLEILRLFESVENFKFAHQERFEVNESDLSLYLHDLD